MAKKWMKWTTEYEKMQIVANKLLNPTKSSRQLAKEHRKWFKTILRVLEQEITSNDTNKIKEAMKHQNYQMILEWKNAIHSSLKKRVQMGDWTLNLEEIKVFWKEVQRSSQQNNYIDGVNNGLWGQTTNIQFNIEKVQQLVSQANKEKGANVPKLNEELSLYN